MGKILNFSSYVFENYPNLQDDKSKGEQNSKPTGIGSRGFKKFSLLGSNFIDFLLAEDVENNLYIGYFDTASDEIRGYVQTQKVLVGRDEDGLPDYDYVDLKIDPDEETLEKYMANLTRDEIGKGLKDWDEGVPLVKIDSDLAKVVYEDFRKILKNPRLNSKSRDFYVNSMNKILDKFPDSETLVDLAGLDLPK